MNFKISRMILLDSFEEKNQRGADPGPSCVRKRTRGPISEQAAVCGTAVVPRAL